jgi:hypothetical protein
MIREQPPLTQSDLDAVAVCRNPACTGDHADGMIMTPACHPGGSVTVWYSPETGLLLLRCRACNEPFARIEVAF